MNLRGGIPFFGVVHPLRLWSGVGPLDPLGNAGARLGPGGLLWLPTFDPYLISDECDDEHGYCFFRFESLAPRSLLTLWKHGYGKSTFFR